MTGELKAAFVFIAAGALSALLFIMFIISNQGFQKGALVSEEKEKLKASLQMTVHRNVSIYHSEAEKSILHLTKETLDDAEAVSRTLFGNLRSDKVDLIFFSSREEMESFSQLKDITGFYSENLRMIGLLPEEKKQLLNGKGFAVFLYKRVLIHEYTHFTFHEKLRELNASPKQFPLWFHEGVAEWAAAHDEAYARNLATVVPFRKLKSDRQWQQARDDDETDIYLQSFYIIEELVARKGEGIILKIMEKTAERNNFESGFKAAVDQELSEFENDFTQKYGKTALNHYINAVFVINESVSAAFGRCLEASASDLEQARKPKAFFAYPEKQVEAPGNSRVCFGKERFHKPSRYSEEFGPQAPFCRQGSSPRELPWQERNNMSSLS